MRISEIDQWVKRSIPIRCSLSTEPVHTWVESKQCRARTSSAASTEVGDSEPDLEAGMNVAAAAAERITRELEATEELIKEEAREKARRQRAWRRGLQMLALEAVRTLIMSVIIIITCGYVLQLGQK